MSRPLKSGLEYFPVDTDMYEDDKTFLIRGEAGGVKAYGILMVLLQSIYKDKGYYIGWTERDKVLFCQRKNIEIDDCERVVSSALKWDFFDKKIFNDHKKLTSRAIQNRYIHAASKRKKIVISESIKLLTEETPLNDNIYLVNDVKSTHSKVKESKVKYGAVVMLSETEYQRLVDMYGKRETDKMILTVDGYCEANGKTYKSYSAAVRNFFSRDGVSPDTKVYQTCPKGHRYTGDVCERCI
jgi:hypothetical protein